ncbi:hypothetical protein A3I46_01795 [Candidatus Kaiserbacteria bacterium RIFCSPLOWO2_02_FULL_54_13]|nr:MAG: hypothetical protein UY91_C0029G0005 [Parcubacteria group bacterium GW2011_GWB1_55_9]OGG83085.1 MAG: hypothetical protein A3I46_01795 [Candidatus Kaiserbacteria bacterium RIFCSPLOWO2_02_FULL_54_13]
MAFWSWLEENEKIRTEAYIWELLWRVPLACAFWVIVVTLWLGVYGFLLVTNYAASELQEPTIIIITILYDTFLSFVLFQFFRSR